MHPSKPYTVTSVELKEDVFHDRGKWNYLFAPILLKTTTMLSERIDLRCNV
jgi:hypothetical protein